MVERLNCDIIIVDTMKPIQKMSNSKFINECQEKKTAIDVQKDKNR